MGVSTKDSEVESEGEVVEVDDGRILEDAEVAKIIEAGGGENFANFQRDLNIGMVNLKKRWKTLANPEEVIEDLKKKLDNPVLIYLRDDGKFIGYRLMTEGEKKEYRDDIDKYERKIERRRGAENESAPDTAVDEKEVENKFDPEKRFLDDAKLDYYLKAGTPRLSDVEARFNYIEKNKLSLEDELEALERLWEVVKNSVLKTEQYEDNFGKKHMGSRFMTREEMLELESRIQKMTVEVEEKLRAERSTRTKDKDDVPEDVQVNNKVKDKKKISITKKNQKDELLSLV